MTIIILALAVLIAACAPKMYDCPDGSRVADPVQCRNPVPPAGPSSQPSVAQKVERAVSMDPELRALLDKQSKVQSMSFTYAPVRILSTGPVISQEGKYYVRGANAKVELTHPNTVDPKTIVETVYLDLQGKTARCFCNQPKTRCSVPGEERPAAYSDYAITLPTEWQLPADAELKGSRSFENRDVRVVQYAQEGKYYETYIDSFTGVPIRIGIYSDPDYTLLVGGMEYRSFAINQVRDADVLPPK